MLWPTATRGDSTAAAHSQGALLVGLPAVAARSDATLATLLRRTDASSAQPLFTTRSTAVLRLLLPTAADVPAAIRSLRTSHAEDILFAEPDFIAHAAADPLLSSQWGLTRIDAPAAWSIVADTTSTVIAVIDSGIDASHPDLAEQLWTNPGEVPANGIDDDSNGYVDDVHGWNFLAGTNRIADDSGHGTQVAGVAAAASNDVGIAGVCPGCRLMVVKVMRPNGTANYSDIAAGVAYARANGAHVINLSLGGYSDSATLRTAIAAAVEDAIVVAAAGNDAESRPFFPAALPQVLAVAATQRNDARAEFSNYGAWVQLAAPGVDIVTTALGGGWATVRGTSLSAPFVAGVAALVRAQHPEWTPSFARTHLLQTTRSLPAAEQLGYGLPNAAAALQDSQPRLSITRISVNGAEDGRPTPGDDAMLAVTLHNDWLGANNVAATLSTEDPYVTIRGTTSDFGDMQSGQEKTGGAFSIRIASSAGYRHPISFQLRITADDGAYDETRTFVVTTRSNEELICGYASGTWTRDMTYIVVCPTSVPEGSTLRIEPGASVLFRGNHSFDVHGELIADGAAEQPITFAPETAGAAWPGLLFADAGVDAQVDDDGTYRAGNLLRHAQIYGARDGVRCDGATPYISNVTIDSGGLTCTTSEGASVRGISDSAVPRVRQLRAVRLGEVDSKIFVAAPFDFDGDGDKDLAVGYGNRCRRNEIYLNDGTGKFEDSIEFGPDDICTKAIVAEDFNSDGLPDLALGNWFGASSMQINYGGGFYEVPFSNAVGTTSLASCDVDGDGDLDLIAGNRDQKNVVYFNNGGAGLTQSRSFGQSNEDTVDVACANFDHDSRVDIVAANETGGATLPSRLFFNLGQGVFDIAPWNSVYLGIEPGPIYDVDAGDVDGDGDLDLAFAYQRSRTGVWKQDGPGVFTRLKHIGRATDSTESVAFGDADGDGDLDLAVGFLALTKTLYLNDGTGAFSTSIHFKSSSGNANFVWFDADGDGDLDLFGGSGYANAYVYFNEMSSPLWVVASDITGDMTIAGRAAVLNSILTAGNLHIRSDALVRGNILRGGGIIVDAAAIVEGNEVTGATGAALTSGGIVTATSNRFVDNAVGVIAKAGSISGNLIADSADVGLRIGKTIVTDNTFFGNRGGAIEIQNAAPITISGNNFVGEASTFDIFVSLAERVQIDAMNNWWGAKSTDEIAARIYDFQENYARATVMHAPALSSPAAAAPAYVLSVTISPDEVIGIQMAAFDVEFSRPMHTDATVLISADDLSEDGFTSAAWTAPNRFSAQYDVTARVPRGTKIITVTGAVGTDGIEIAPAHNFAFVVDYAAFAADDTPPAPPKVEVISDGATDRLTLRWSTIETESSITAWRYAMGTTPGGTDVVDWTDVTVDTSMRGTTTNEFSIVHSGLNLLPGLRYYGSVQARNAGGLWSEAGVSEDAVAGEMTSASTPSPSPTLANVEHTATDEVPTPIATPALSVDVTPALSVDVTPALSVDVTPAPSVGVTLRIWAPIIMR